MSNSKPLWSLVSKGVGLSDHYVVRSTFFNCEIELSNNSAEANLLLSALNLLSADHKSFNICTIK